MKVEERLLKYVSVWTTSDEDGTTLPSTQRQFDLAKILKAELEGMGLEKVTMTDQCYVYGLLPATAGCENKKAIGLIAHMDTAPDFSGENVKPQIIENYDGEDVVLKGSGAILSTKDFPELKDLKGRTLITTDGTTLLGADDKAGVSAIMTAVEELVASGEAHGDIWVGFTPDEEIGAGPNGFDLDYFKADFAYTVDGDYEGEVAYENFNAYSAGFEIHGKNVHPGEAKDIMINAALIGCEIAASLPADETPAATCDHEGFYHLTDMEGNVEKATLSYILRDHDANKIQERIKTLEELTKKMNEKYGEGTVELSVKHSYDNMIEVMKDHMEVIDLAKEAIQAQGLQPLSRPIRGGTDGARLSFMGLPCPNLGTGGYGFHGPFEHCTVEGMECVVRILRYIATHAPQK